MNSKKQLKIERVFWLDAMRVLAILMVVVIHSSAKVLYEWEVVSHTAWNFANVLNAFSRISVPLFVMISGACILHKTENLKEFLEKRIPRIVIPWFIWGTIQLLYNYNFSINQIINTNVASKIMATYFGGFWFMPMILALYLITPLLKPFVQTAKNRDFGYFFILWFIVASCIPTLNKAGLNISMQLPIWIQYLGYFVAGYYLVHRIKIRKILNKQITLLFLVTSTVIALGTYALTLSDSAFNTSLYEYTHIFVVITSITGFITLQRILQNKVVPFSKKMKMKITALSKASFGIFLAHSLVLDILTRGSLGITINGLTIHPIIGLPLTVMVVFSTTALIVTSLQKINPKLFG